MINKIILIGRLGKDPEIAELKTGDKVGKFSIATSESYKNKQDEWVEKTEWHDVVVWRHLAEKAERQLKKGSLIYLEGKLTHRKWEDKEGNKRKNSEVVPNYFRILEKGSDQNEPLGEPQKINHPINSQPETDEDGLPF